MRFSHVTPSVLYWMYPSATRISTLPPPPEPLLAASLMAATRLSFALVVRLARSPIWLWMAANHAFAGSSGGSPGSSPVRLRRIIVAHVWDLATTSPTR